MDLGFEALIGLGWVTTLASPTICAAQATITGSDEMTAPGVAAEVADVDAVHATVVERGFENAWLLSSQRVTRRLAVCSRLSQSGGEPLSAGFHKSSTARDLMAG